MVQTPNEILRAIQPELNCTHAGIANEQHEQSVIVNSDAVLCPYAMMIHFVDAAAAAAAMGYPRKLVILAFWTFFRGQVVNRVHMLFRLKVLFTKQLSWATFV